jgi:hypothetical protein
MLRILQTRFKLRVRNYAPASTNGILSCLAVCLIGEGDSISIAVQDPTRSLCAVCTFAEAAFLFWDFASCGVGPSCLIIYGYEMGLVIEQ